VYSSDSDWCRIKMSITKKPKKDLHQKQTDLNEDLVAGAEDDSETEFNDLDLDTFINVLLNDNDWLRSKQTHESNYRQLLTIVLFFVKIIKHD